MKNGDQLEEEGRAVVGGEEEEGGKEALVTSRAVCCPPELAAITRRPSIFLPDTLQGVHWSSSPPPSPPSWRLVPIPQE